VAKNKQIFFDFVKWLRSDATTIKSDRRILKYYAYFWQILRYCRKNVDEARSAGAA